MKGSAVSATMLKNGLISGLLCHLPNVEFSGAVPTSAGREGYL